jgi:predicted lysophospholipase L1 biosynthesis ABC-type transport system permease subunit
MEDAIVTLQFPGGTLPVRGGRCPIDGDEKIRGEDLVDAQALAHELGLYGLEGAVERKIGTTGTSASVTLPPDLLARLGLKPGSVVEIGAAGEALVIRKARPQKPKRRRTSR